MIAPHSRRAGLLGGVRAAQRVVAELPDPIFDESSTSLKRRIVITTRLHVVDGYIEIRAPGLGIDLTSARSSSTRVPAGELSSAVQAGWERAAAPRRRRACPPLYSPGPPLPPANRQRVGEPADHHLLPGLIAPADLLCGIGI